MLHPLRNIVRTLWIDHRFHPLGRRKKKSKSWWRCSRELRSNSWEVALLQRKLELFGVERSFSRCTVCLLDRNFPRGRNRRTLHRMITISIIARGLCMKREQAAKKIFRTVTLEEDQRDAKTALLLYLDAVAQGASTAPPSIGASQQHRTGIPTIYKIKLK